MTTSTPTRAELEKAIAAQDAETAKLKEAYREALADQPTAIVRAKKRTKDAQLAMHRSAQKAIDLRTQLDALRTPAPQPKPELEPADSPVEAEPDAAPLRTTKKKRTPRRAD